MTDAPASGAWLPLTPDLATASQAAWGRFERRHDAAVCADVRARLDQLGLAEEVDVLQAASPFFAEQFARNDDLLTEPGIGWLLSETTTLTEFQDRCQALTDGADNEDAFMAALRRWRGREMLRIVWRDFTARATVQGSLADITALADTAVAAALAFAEAQLRPRYGTPMGRDSGKPQSLIVLGMGKLGGGELNLSSDIDLIFAYPEAGETTGGRKQVSNQEYFIKLGQMLIRLLDAVTVDGFVFRVDMRLRPYGDSGALVANFDALELYYQEQGREWERYAMMKARPLTGDPDSLAALNDMIRRFVYRRYTDFGVIESLRDMKAMIVAESHRQGFADNIKKGAGGIREIEFIAQCLQLIHGGRIPAVQCRGLREALDVLADNGLMHTDDSRALDEAYCWLRRLENVLQGIDDKQTQTLPADALGQARVAHVLGFPDWTALCAKLDSVRAVVADQFAALIAPEPSSEAQSDVPLRLAELDSKGLAQCGFTEPEVASDALQQFLDSSRIRCLQGDSRQRLERFLPRLCIAAGQAGDAGTTVLERLLPLVAAVSRRSAYLVLLEENPGALRLLVELAEKSAWIAQKLADRPELLDELLDAERLTTAPDRAAMQDLVRQQLLRIPTDDLEAQMYALGRIKDAVVLRVAASELTDRLPIMQVSDHLTFLAEVIIEQAIYVARAELVSRHGEPQGDDCGFAVMGYGKLGGIELSYGSDLDIVFVFGGGSGETAGPRVIDNARYYTRLAQRVVHVLSTKMSGGMLYDVDLRLRPHGDSGLVAVSLNAFEQYQQSSAWTWEHQALARSRPVAGDQTLQQALADVRARILSQPRDVNTLRDEVISMRRRMLADGSTRLTSPEGYFDIKRDPGGIVDIEFVVQYLVLAHAEAVPGLVKWSDVVRVLETLAEAGVLSDTDAIALNSAYLAYRSAVHVAALRGEDALGNIDDYREHLEAVSAIREHWLPGVVGNAS